MSEATRIDTLSIEIVSNSNNAVDSLEDLAIALEDIKSSGKVSAAVNNLKGLAGAIKEIANARSPRENLTALKDGIKAIKDVGSITPITNRISNLVEALGNTKTIDLTGVDDKFKEIASALSSLSGVKSGGFATMVNALAKISKVTESLDDDTIAKFADRVKVLNDTLEPLSTKMVTIQQGLKGINSSAKTTASGMKNLGSRVNSATLNLSSLITVARGTVAALRPVVQLLTETIGQAIEWDGVAARFGRGFGDQANEVYAWIRRLNEEMGINTQQFMQYSSVFATMLQGFGVSVADSGKMALGYTELIYDIWAGYNDVYKSFADAADAVKSAIAGEVEPIRRAGFTIVESTLQQTAANYGLDISLEKATESQKSYLRYLTLVDQAYAQNLVGAYARELNTAEGLMRTFAQQLKSLAQTVGSVFLPILVRVMPWLQAFVTLLSEAVIALAGFFGIEIQPVSWSGLGSDLGGIGGAADNAAASLGDTAGAVNDTTDAIKELKNAAIGIDELNVISPPDPTQNSGGAGGAGGGGGGAFDGLDVDSLWDESIFDQIQADAEKIKAFLKDALSGITALVSGFMLAIGTILVVTGANIPLGLGLMAAGAVGLVAAVALNWNGMSDRLAGVLATITSVVGGFLLAIGTCLAFTGVNVPLGAALMSAGAVSLATAVAINWNFMEEKLRGTLSILTGIIAGSLLAVGAVLAFTGVNVPMGVALMAAGAVSFVTAATLNWESLPESMRKAIGTLEAIVGGSLLTFGAILAFSGANIPLGIGMIAAGVVSLAAAAVLNWDSLTGELRNAIATVTALVSGALLGIGAILAFSGAAIPLGISMMAAGAVGLVASASMNWGFITDKVKGVLQELGVLVGGSLIAIGLILACSGVALPIGIGLIAAGAAGVVSGVALNWDTIVNLVKTTTSKITQAWNDMLNACLTGFQKMTTGVVAAFNKLWSAVTAGIQNLCNSIISMFNNLYDVLVGHSIVPDTVDGIVDCFDSLPDQTLGLIDGFVKKTIGKFDVFGFDLLSVIESAWNMVESWWSKGTSLEIPKIEIGLVKQGWSTITDWIGEIPDLQAKIDFVKDGWTTVKNWMGNIDFIKGFEAVMGRASNTVSVADNDHGIESFAESMYSAVLAAMRQSEFGGTQAVNVYLDSRQITSTVEKRQRERGSIVTRNNVYAY